MSKSPSRLGAQSVAAFMSGFLLLTGCAGAETDPPAAATPDETEPASEATGDESSGDEAVDGAELRSVFAEIAAMDPSDRWDVVYERAREEGEVVLYSTSSVDTLRDWQDDFMDLYPGIDLNTLRAGAANMYDRLSAEARAGHHTVDVIMASDAVSFLRDDGLLADIEPAILDDRFPTSGTGEWWVSLGISPFGLTWNTDLVADADAPQSYEDLLDERWRGKVAIDADPIQWVTALVTAWGEERAESYLEELMANEPVVRSGHTQITQLLAGGEFPVAAALYLHTVERMRADDAAPLAWTLTDPIPNAGGGLITVATNAANPYATALLMNYVTSARGQEIRAASGRITLHPDADSRFPTTEAIKDDPRLIPTAPGEGFEELETAQRLITEVITPAYIGE